MIIRSHAPCLESHGERLIAPPVRRQDGAEEVGTVGPNQLAGVVRQDVHHVPGVRSRPEGPRGGHGPVAVSNLAAGEGRGGRREPSGGGRLYGNMHHNSLGQCHLTGSYQKSGTLWEKKTVWFQSLIFVFSSRRSQESSVWAQRMEASARYVWVKNKTKPKKKKSRYLNRDGKVWSLC